MCSSLRVFFVLFFVFLFCLLFFLSTFLFAFLFVCFFQPYFFGFFIQCNLYLKAHYMYRFVFMWFCCTLSLIRWKIVCLFYFFVTKWKKQTNKQFNNYKSPKCMNRKCCCYKMSTSTTLDHMSSGFNESMIRIIYGLAIYRQYKVTIDAAFICCYKQYFNVC